MQKADIDKLAALARLDMSDSEKESLLGDFGAILEYIDQISSVNVSSTSDIQNNTLNVVREDVAIPADENTLGLISENLPESTDGFLKVKQIL
jgi:aspartyl-tRNA(Asn)/glutamyl-tRNA(Gln) amidotransferase subunit C